MKLVMARLYEKEQKLEVVVEDDQGRMRQVVFGWRTKEFTPLPADWMKTVKGELDAQDSDEMAKKRGRVLFK